MLATDFAKRTRARITEARAALVKFNAAYKEATRQLAKIAKEAEEENLDKAYELQEEIREVAGTLEDIDMGERDRRIGQRSDRRPHPTDLLKPQGGREEALCPGAPRREAETLSTPRERLREYRTNEPSGSFRRVRRRGRIEGSGNARKKRLASHTKPNSASRRQVSTSAETSIPCAQAMFSRWSMSQKRPAIVSARMPLNRRGPCASSI